MKILSKIKPTLIVNKKNKADITILISITFMHGNSPEIKVDSRFRPTFESYFGYPKCYSKHLKEIYPNDSRLTDHKILFQCPTWSSNLKSTLLERDLINSFHFLSHQLTSGSGPIPMYTLYKFLVKVAKSKSTKFLSVNFLTNRHFFKKRNENEITFWARHRHF